MLIRPNDCPHCGSSDVHLLRGTCRNCNKLIYVSPALNTSAFRLGTMLMAMVLPAICLGVWRLSPLAAIIIAAPTAIAFLRTYCAISYSSVHGHAVSLTGVAFTFVVSFALVCNIVVCVVAAFGLGIMLSGALVNSIIVLWFDGSPSNAITALALTTVMATAGTAGSVVGLTMLRFGWHSHPIRPWQIDRRY